MAPVLSAALISAALAADRPEIGVPRPLPWEEPAKVEALIPRKAAERPRPAPRVPSVDDLLVIERAARALRRARTKEEAFDPWMALDGYDRPGEPAAKLARAAKKRAKIRGLKAVPTASRAGLWRGWAEERPLARAAAALRALLPGPPPAPRERPPVLVSRAQVRELSARLLPGDLLLIRRERYLAPDGAGFWDEAAVYVGGFRVVGSGMEPFARAAAADHLAILRPRLGGQERVDAARAARALRGRRLTGLELARLVYGEAAVPPGPADALVAALDRTYGTAGQRWDLVAYLAADEAQARARPSGIEDFRRTHRLPRWTPLPGANAVKEGSR